MGQRNRIEFQTGALFAGAFALLILPLSFFFSFVVAGMFHEFCHYLMLHWTGMNVYRIRIGPFGVSMETEPMEPGREVFCALAGPVGSLMLAACYRFIPIIAICALIQGCFNLLPIYPLDGGRVVNGILEILKLPGREYIFSIIQCLAVLVISIICVYAFLEWNLGCGVLIVGALLLLRTLPRKTPCKEAHFRVQ